MELLQFEKQPLHIIYIYVMSLEIKNHRQLNVDEWKESKSYFEVGSSQNFTTSLRNHFFSHRNDIFPTIWKGQEIEFFFMFFNNVDESGVIWSCPPSIEKFLSPFYHHSAGCWSLNDPLEIQKIGLMSVQRSLYYIMGRLAGVIITPEDGNMLIKGERGIRASSAP